MALTGERELGGPPNKTAQHPWCDVGTARPRLSHHPCSRASPATTAPLMETFPPDSPEAHRVLPSVQAVLGAARQARKSSHCVSAEPVRRGARPSLCHTRARTWPWVPAGRITHRHAPGQGGTALRPRGAYRRSTGALPHLSTRHILWLRKCQARPGVLGSRAAGAHALWVNTLRHLLQIPALFFVLNK